MLYNPFVAPRSSFSEKQIKDIKKQAKSIFDKVMEFDVMNDQIDVIGKRGGDICHFRWYADGTMVEK